MPLPLGHTAIGIATHSIFSKDEHGKLDWQTTLVITVLANLPDIDVIFGLILQNNGSAFHRGPTHSILFAVIAGYAIYKTALWLQKAPRLSLMMGMAIILSHILADAVFTNAPVSFFWPLEVYWSTGNAGWQDIVHAVVFEAARDGAIVIVCTMLVISNTIAQRRLGKGLLDLLSIAITSKGRFTRCETDGCRDSAV